MKATDVQRIISNVLGEYAYQTPPPDTTYGEPWAEAKVLREVEALKNALVTPYLHAFLLRDTYEQVTTAAPNTQELWVVAHMDELCEFYDPAHNEFGLAELPVPGHSSSTIGVRGDLVGVFCAQ
jgi:hypothetical protein